MIRLCGAALGVFAFAVTILLGLAAGNPAGVTIGRAVTALFVFCALGLGAGWVANRILDEHAVAKNREMFPEVPEDAPSARTEQRPGEPAMEQGGS